MKRILSSLLHYARRIKVELVYEFSFRIKFANGIMIEAVYLCRLKFFILFPVKLNLKRTKRRPNFRQ